ncbi:hypothetical protein [Cellulophaga sp. Ld12]|uniref:hypothetical protein n=1 Tax=Cellulophaga sp. Ld12 TaxID=3229535 RepID=UPI003870AEDC
MKTALSVFVFMILFLSCKDESNVQKPKSGNEHLIVMPGIGTEKFVVGKTKIKNIITELGKPEKFTQGIIDYRNKEAAFTNSYYYTKYGMTFSTETLESKGQDIENAIIRVIIFDENSNAKTLEGLAMDGIAGKINYVYGKQDEDRTPRSDLPYFHYRKKGLTVKINPETKKVSEFEIYEPHE